MAYPPVQDRPPCQGPAAGPRALRAAPGWHPGSGIPGGGTQPSPTAPRVTSRHSELKINALKARSPLACASLTPKSRPGPRPPSLDSFSEQLGYGSPAARETRGYPEPQGGTGQGPLSGFIWPRDREGKQGFSSTAPWEASGVQLAAAPARHSLSSAPQCPPLQGVALAPPHLGAHISVGPR